MESNESRRHKFCNQVRKYKYETAKEETPQAVILFEQKAEFERRNKVDDTK